MSLVTAQRYAWNLAKTLMVCITLFQTPKGYGAVPSNEYEGDADSVITEYDPFAR